MIQKKLTFCRGQGWILRQMHGWAASTTQYSNNKHGLNSVFWGQQWELLKPKSIQATLELWKFNSGADELLYLRHLHLERRHLLTEMDP